MMTKQKHKFGVQRVYVENVFYFYELFSTLQPHLGFHEMKQLGESLTTLLPSASPSQGKSVYNKN